LYWKCITGKNIWVFIDEKTAVEGRITAMFNAGILLVDERGE
jgi:hypothetical protein